MDSNIKGNHQIFKEFKEEVDKREYNHNLLLLEICILDNFLKGTINNNLK